jgi:hypothetical protein
MVDRFGKLIIPRSTVEAIGKQEIGELMVGFTWRPNVWKYPYKLIQVGAIQLIGMAIVFAALMLPVDRVVNTDRFHQSQSDRLTRLIWVDGTITVLILGGVNGWIFYRGKGFQRLLKLVAQIDRYNQIVNSIATLEKVADLTNNYSESSQTDNTIDILNRTRQNLLTALEVDLYLRQHPQANDLTIAITNNLIDLQNLAQQPQLAEYSTLLTQAWEIGMSVYRETNNSV